MASFAFKHTNNAIPGLAWPGFATPGEPIGAGQATFTYSGGQAAYYPQYIDVTTMKTLTVVPGRSYTFVAVGGDPGVPIPPNDDANWH